MVRRDFVKQLLALAAPIGIFKILSNNYLNAINQNHVCLINISFPPSKGLNDFLSSRKNWMNLDDYERIVREFQQKGLLLSKKKSFLPSSIQVAYVFENLQSHDAFVRRVDSINAVSDIKLESIGYKFKREYQRVSA